ncbi:MAG: hypothetical protein GX053_01185 [Tissierella sp.]|nr:hypothetical protein [Tissierella sp.]
MLNGWANISIQDPGGDISIIDDNEDDTGNPIISVKKMDIYENMEITDWLNENTVIISKENTTLEKMVY